MSGPGSGFYVTITTPKGTTVKRVDGDTLTVGRGDDCNLRVTNPDIGRRHLKLFVKNGQCYVEDHGSANGTFVNGTRVQSHVPIPLSAKDQIQIGRTGVCLNAQLGPSGTQEEEESDGPSIEHSVTSRIITTTAEQRKVARQDAQQVAPAIESKSVSQTQEETERILFEAQRKAATFIQNAEMEGERKAQEIYKRAEEALQKADQAYHRRMNDAFRESETVFQKAQGEAAQIMESARQNAMEIRKKAEAFIVDQRHRTEEECEDLLADAQKTSRELKESRLLEADDLIRAKETALLKETRESIATRLADLETEIKKNTELQQKELTKELSSRRALADSEYAEQLKQLESLKESVSQSQESAGREKSALNELEGAVRRQTEKLNNIQAEIESASQELESAKGKSAETRVEVMEHEKTSSRLQKQIKEAQAKLGEFNEEVRRQENLIKQAKEGNNLELLKIKDAHEAAKIKLLNDEKNELEQIKLENVRKAKVLEQQMYEELQFKKDNMAREMSLTVEAFLKQSTDSPTTMKPLQDKIKSQFDTQIASLNSDPTVSSKGKTLVALKRQERVRMMTMGTVLGIGLYWGGLTLNSYLRADTSPIARQVAAVEEERKRDLERRRFNPIQTADLKDTYVDSVIYTTDFATTYTDDAFQKKFQQALSPYLLNTWRLEEEKSIQLLSISDTLVQQLMEKRKSIHPDYVQSDIAKMHELENKKIVEMTQLLGSQVRYESYKKFEKQFFETYKR